MQGSTPVAVSGTGNTRTFTMSADDVTVTASFKALGYPVTISANKDGGAWSDHGKVFKLSKDSGANFVTDLTKVQDGTYTIYETDGTSTGVTVTADGVCVYTTDGSDPRYSDSKKVGTQSDVLAVGTVIRAYAYKPKCFPSGVCEVIITG